LLLYYAMFCKPAYNQKITHFLKPHYLLDQSEPILLDIIGSCWCLPVQFFSALQVLLATIL
jgi:hypothetical protein